MCPMTSPSFTKRNVGDSSAALRLPDRSSSPGLARPCPGQTRSTNVRNAPASSSSYRHTLTLALASGRQPVPGPSLEGDPLAVNPVPPQSCLDCRDIDHFQRVRNREAHSQSTLKL